LRFINPALTLDVAMVLADAIIGANDKGDFDAAWLALDRAFTFVPEPNV